MKTSRREFIVSSSAALAATSIPSEAANLNTDAVVEKTLAEFAEELLVAYPENATALGIDTAKRASLKAKLSDRSPSGQKAIANQVATRLEKLKAVDTSNLSNATRIDVDVLRTAHEFAKEGFAFPYGDVALLNANWSWRNAPYVVAQNTGAFLEIPGLLNEQHSVKTRADAEAYLARLEQYAGQLDGETERLKLAAALKVVAPDFLLDKTLSQIKIARGGNISQWPIVTSLAKPTAKMPGEFGLQAEKIAKDKIAPALDRQIAELEAHRRRATSDAGVWKLPQGEAYYAWTLAASTTTRMTPQEIHDVGQEQVRELNSEMDAILKRKGMTAGTVGERMLALGRMKAFQFADSDEGREKVLAFFAERVRDMRSRLPRAFATQVRGNVEIKRMAPEVEPGAPGAYGGAGTIDGKVPGKFWVNLGDMSAWSTFNMPTLAYHESIPGHVWQGEYTFKMPLARSLLAFNAYSEGWALYAEQLADELGVYDNDPYGRLGYLQSINYRACRLVVDTGLHVRRWTRQQAIEWFAATNGSGIGGVTSEVDRYCAWPGQACGYKIGHSEINRLRKNAQQSLGTKFDLRLFNDVVVKTGGVPMVTLARIVEGFVAKQR